MLLLGCHHLSVGWWLLRLWSQQIPDGRHLFCFDLAFGVCCYADSFRVRGESTFGLSFVCFMCFQKKITPVCCLKMLFTSTKPIDFSWPGIARCFVSIQHHGGRKVTHVLEMGVGCSHLHLLSAVFLSLRIIGLLSSGRRAHSTPPTPSPNNKAFC